MVQQTEAKLYCFTVLKEYFKTPCYTFHLLDSVNLEQPEATFKSHIFILQWNSVNSNVCRQQ